MYIMPPCVVAGAAVVLAAIYLSPPSVAQSFHWDEHAASSRAAAAPGSLVERSRKADRLPVLTGAPQPEPNSNVEVIEFQKVGVVLRGRNGTLLFRSDQAAANTIVAKGVIVPEIMITGRPAGDQQPDRLSAPGPSDPAASPVSPSVNRRAPPAPAKLPGCESAVSAMARSSTFDVPGRCIARNLHAPSLVVALN